MIERYDFAPLDGITRGVYRRVWQRRFGGADRLFIPFFSPTDQHVLTERDRRELLGSPGIPQVPQVMTCRAEDLVWAAELLRDLGFTEVNLNLGCPSGTVTAKGKGAGFLAEPEALDRFFDAACGRLCLPLSVKTRLGVRSPEEFARLLPIFDRYPITCLTIHARVKTEKYRGNVHLEEFAQALAQSRNPVCYNGDLRTVGETEAFAARFPAARAVMIGRGAVADPALFRKLRGGPPATRKELRDFLQELYAEYQRFYGQVGTAAQRMREVWFYLIHLFDDADRLNKKLRRFRSPGEYEAIEDAILRELPLRQDCQGELV